jgi:hypothetical protein
MTLKIRASDLECEQRWLRFAHLRTTDKPYFVLKIWAVVMVNIGGRQV